MSVGRRMYLTSNLQFNLVYLELIVKQSRTSKRVILHIHGNKKCKNIKAEAYGFLLLLQVIGK